MDTPNPASPFSSLPHPWAWTTRSLQPPASASSSPHINWGRDYFNTILIFFLDSPERRKNCLASPLAVWERKEIAWSIAGHFPSSLFFLVVQSSLSCSFWSAAKKSKQQCPPASVLTAITAKSPCWGRSTSWKRTRSTALSAMRTCLLTAVRAALYPLAVTAR